MSLNQSGKFERGHKDELLPKSFIYRHDFQPLYLFPSEHATELSAELLKSYSRPINLIVPDGTWRQAKKVHRREELLEGVPHVKITPKKSSRYTLRRQKYENGLSTFEAIAEALRVIEGEECYELLQRNFTLFLEAHHKNRDIWKPIKKKGIHRSP